jgi:sporulation protein YlmC with PRC-barrel domain
MNVSDLLTLTVRSDSGWTFGRVHDVRIERSPNGTATVTALLVGSEGLRERLTGRVSSKRVTIRAHGFEIPWKTVTAIDDNVITIKERP